MAQVGGRRAGAGRPKGTANRKTREIADRCAAEGLTPLEVMLDVMRRAHAAADYGTALDAAAKAAPFVHARLSSVDLKATVNRDIEEYSDAELIALAMQASRDDREGAEAPPRTH